MTTQQKRNRWLLGEVHRYKQIGLVWRQWLMLLHLAMNPGRHSFSRLLTRGPIGCTSADGNRSRLHRLAELRLITITTEPRNDGGLASYAQITALGLRATGEVEAEEASTIGQSGN